MSFGQIDVGKKWFNYRSPSFHAGIEYNLFWNWGDNDILLANYIVVRDSQDNFSSFETNKFSFDVDFSLQFSIYDKFIIRYTFIRHLQNISGPIGVDRSYTWGDRFDLAYDLEETNYTYDGSGQVLSSNILSIGYPIDVLKLFGNRSMPIIPFIGIDFQHEQLMDIYTHHTGFSDWYFLDEFEWRIENITSKRSPHFSFGFSIPIGIQISYVKSRGINRIMFGMGF